MRAAAAAAVGLVACAHETPAPRAPTKQSESEEAEVTPGEDLMQEHGILERILLVYDESARRLESNEQADPTVVASAAGIVRRFIEEYHERQEERFVFPKLQAAKSETELVAVLFRQHERGRQLTDEIVRKAQSGGPELAALLRSFARMYRPHAAREDTVLIPALRRLLDRDAYRELGEQFEEEEHRRFGEHGFEETVAEVAKLEAALGIGELDRFTP
ncbi:MAG TPA: hemerythrin domain-containing protein [Polyangiaceae bacterium]|nr:hemerythrin domain-containing protein [Polyangiaceae bacterium]